MTTRGIEISENAQLYKNLEMRSAIFRSVRNYLDTRNFIEVETPLIKDQHTISPTSQFRVATEARTDFGWIRTTPEHYAIRLLAAYDAVYELGKDVRSETPDATHQREFTVLEAYKRNADWKDMMRLTETLVEHTARAVLGTAEVTFRGERINLAAPWRRITLREAICQKTGIDFYEYPTSESLCARMREKGIDVAIGTRAQLLYKLAEQHEPDFVQPTFITEHPADWKWSSRVRESDHRVREQAEVLIGKGMELANVYTLETDANIIRRNNLATLEYKRNIGLPDHPLDEDFLTDLAALPHQAAESAIGIDRLVMLLTGQSDIRDVIAFPEKR